MAKVYVSSPLLDLEPERQAVLDWLRLADHQAADSYVPNSGNVSDSCLNDIDRCDLYVLILGHHYGFQPTDANPENLSITHLEFRRAGDSDIPRIALLRTSIPDIKLSDLEDSKRAPLVHAFRSEVACAVRAGEFSDLKGLIVGLSTGIQRELEKLASAGKRRSTDWVATQLAEVAGQFSKHMAASVLTPTASPERSYFDLVVVRRRRNEEGERGTDTQPSDKGGLPLETVIARTTAPLLLVGDGGAGKTTSLLYLAARAAERARNDHAALIPVFVNLARITRMNDTADLLQLIADSVPLVKDWPDLLALDILGERRVLFLFDSFNEVPEHLQRTCAVALSRFVDKHKRRHVCVIGSRSTFHIEQMTRPPSTFERFEILRLTPEQVRGFLESHGLGSLYERMPTTLRELAGNPFMLLAMAQTLARSLDQMLPRNQGTLYQTFCRGWMERERGKRVPNYSYERVKEPILAYLAKRMTSAGETTAALSNDLEEEMERQLTDIYGRIQRRGGMPDDWTVDRCLAEILGDGILRRADEQLHFMHQSVQEYFTGLYFGRNCPDALVDFTPRLVEDSVEADSLVEVPNHRFVPALIMMAGLLEDSTKIVEALAARNPVLAAAAVSASTHVNHSLRAAVEQRWASWLEHEDWRGFVGASCLALASMSSPRAIQQLLDFAMRKEDWLTAEIADLVLARLGADDAVMLDLVQRIRDLSGGAYGQQEYKIELILSELQSAHVVRHLFGKWRTSNPESPARDRLEALLATLSESVLTAELQRLGASASDQADLAEALARTSQEWEDDNESSGLSEELLQAATDAIQRADRIEELESALANADERALSDGLRSAEYEVCAAAATVAAARQVPVGDLIFHSLLRFDRDWKKALVSALISLWGAQTAVSRLAQVARQEFSDFNLAARVVKALAAVPGEAPSVALRDAVGHDDPEVQAIAIDALTDRGDSGLAAVLVAQLRSAKSPEFVDAALTALSRLRAREAAVLVNDLLNITDTDSSDIHSVWGPSPPGLRWSDAIHQMLVSLDTDADIWQVLDSWLLSNDPAAKMAALQEISRWLGRRELVERTEELHTPERTAQLIRLELSDPQPSVRAAAADTLRKVDSDLVAAGLGEVDVDLRLAAAEALLRMNARETFVRVIDAVLPIAKTPEAHDSQRRAGAVLCQIPGGLDHFYGPIQAAFVQQEWKQTLQLIEAAIEIVPEDANLFWWQGFALRESGLLQQAAESYQHAFELEKDAPVIPLALAQTFLDLGDSQRAFEAARNGVELNPADAEAQSTMSWCSYKAGAFQESVEAGRKAVDLDPVHSNAIWTVLLANIRTSNLDAARSAFRHALRVRQVLSPGLDTSFVPTFLEELHDIDADDGPLSRLVAEIKESFGSERSN